MRESSGSPHNDCSSMTPSGMFGLPVSAPGNRTTVLIEYEGNSSGLSRLFTHKMDDFSEIPCAFRSGVEGKESFAIRTDEGLGTQKRKKKKNYIIKVRRNSPSFFFCFYFFSGKHHQEQHLTFSRRGCYWTLWSSSGGGSGGSGSGGGSSSSSGEGGGSSSS